MLPTQKLRHLLTALLLAVAATAAAYTVSGTVTINMPAGMYVAGGVKAIVK